MDATQEATLRAELSKEALRIMEDTEHSGAQHFAAGQRWRKRATRLGLPATILVAATSTGAGLSALIGWAPWITAVLTFSVAIVVVPSATTSGRTNWPLPMVRRARATLRCATTPAPSSASGRTAVQTADDS
jgi:hypothetical protein